MFVVAMDEGCEARQDVVISAREFTCRMRCKRCALAEQITRTFDDYLAAERAGGDHIVHFFCKDRPRIGSGA